MSSFKLWLQVREAQPRAARGRRGRRAGAARARHQPAAGGSGRTCTATSRPATPSRCARRRRARRSARGSSTTRPSELRRIKGMKSDRGAGAAAAGERGSRSPRLLRARQPRRRPVPLVRWPYDGSLGNRHLRAGEGRLAQARARSTTRTRERRAARRWPTRSRSARPRSSRRTSATWRPGRESGISAVAARPAAARPRSGWPAIARDVRDIAALPDPVGEVVEERHAARTGSGSQKVLVPMGVVAVVYEARPERDDRLLGALHQVGERDRAARVVDGGALERRAGRRGASRRSRRPGCRAGSISPVAGGDRDELRQIASAGRPGGPRHPARGRGAEGRAQGARDGAGHVRGGGQLPRVRGRATPTSTWR